MAVDVDGAPNTYGPAGVPALDNELNARFWENHKPTDRVAGYRTKDGTSRTAVIQGPNDPFPGYYISTSGYFDYKNTNLNDPRRYVNAAVINYTLWGTAAQRAGVRLGDFCVVHSLRTKLTVYAIVGDSGNSSAKEGSLALLRSLGYSVKDGRAGGEDDPKIVVRYFAGTNPNHEFFFHQSDLDAMAATLDLDTDFSEYHAGNAGSLVLAEKPEGGTGA